MAVYHFNGKEYSGRVNLLVAAWQLIAKINPNITSTELQSRLGKKMAFFQKKEELTATNAKYFTEPVLQFADGLFCLNTNGMCLAPSEEMIQKEFGLYLEKE
jgi:hypothetical protein